MPSKQPLILLLTLITLLNGLGNLMVAAYPSPHTSHPLLSSLLSELFPLEFFQFSRSFTLLLGFALLVSAVNMYRREVASVVDRAVHSFFQRLNFLHSFSGLKQYKAKFADSWEPRYVSYRNIFDPLPVGIALGKDSELTQ